MSEITTIDVTAISKIVACDVDTYRDNYESSPNEYTIYLVNEGAPSDGSQVPYTSIYYGGRRCSEISVVKDLSEDLPPNRIYLILQTDDEGNVVYEADGVTLKFDKVIYRYEFSDGESLIVRDISLLSSVFRSFEYDPASQTTIAVLSNGDVVSLPTLIDGELSLDIKESIKTYFVEEGLVLIWNTVSGLIGPAES